MYSFRNSTRALNRRYAKPIRQAVQTTLETLEGRQLLTAGALLPGSPVTRDILGSDSASSVIFDNSGRLVVAGQAGGSSFGIARYLANGVTLDTSYDTDGIQTIPQSGLILARGLVADSSNRVYVGGFGFDSGSGSTDFILARTENDGSSPTVSAPIDIGGSTADQVSTIIRLSSGAIIAVGTSNGNVALARFDPSTLALDSSGSGPFASGLGKVTTSIAGGVNVVGATVDSSGRIIVAATQGGNVLLLRYNSDGSLDTVNFNGTGQKTITIGGASARAVAVQADDQILVLTNEGPNTVLRRVTADGLTVSSPVSLGAGSGTGVAVQAHDQRIAVSISAGGAYKLTRLNTDLSLDDSDSLDSSGSVSVGTGVTTSGIAYYQGGGARRLAIAGTVSNDFGLAVFDANIDPVVSTNASPINVTSGGVRALNATLLQLSDADDTLASGFTYTVTTLPTSGTLKKSGIALAVNGTFTQADLNAGLIEYYNTSGSSDSFQFTATDSYGGSVVAAPVTVSFAMTTPSTVWVDDNWDIVTDLGAPGLSSGDVVADTGADEWNASVPSLIFGVDAFSSISAGHAAVASPGVINVLSGAYVDEIDVTKSVQILGPNASVNPNGGIRMAEATVYPAVSDPDPFSLPSRAIFNVTAANVTISGLTIDGDNTALSSGVSQNGADVDAIEAIGAYAGISNATVLNNIIVNISYAGIDFYNTSGAATSGNTVSQNKFDNIGYIPYGYGIGVLIYNNAYTSITDNVMTRTRLGIQTGNFYQADPGSSATISGNQISATRKGIWNNLSYSAATSYTIQNNTITAVNEAGASRFDGIMLSSLQGTVGAVVSGNIINVPGTVTQPSVGYQMWNLPTSATLTLQGGSVTGASYGVWVNNYDGYPSTGSNGGATAVTVSGMAINNSTIAGVYVKDNAVSSHNAVSATLTGGTTITGGAIGLLVEGAAASVLGLGNTAFSGQSGNYITLANGAMDNLEINGTLASFGGIIGGGSLAQSFAIEDKITHATDSSTVGYVRFAGGKVFVTPNSGSIQRGVDASVNGDTLHVQSGTYAEFVGVNKSISILGPNSAIAGNGVRGSEAIVVPPSNDVASGSLFDVSVNNVTIRGFTLDGDNTLVTGGESLNGIDSNAADGVSAAAPVSGLTVGQNIIVNLVQDGVYLAGGATASGDNLITLNKFDNIPSNGPSYYGRAVLLADNAYASVVDNVATRVRTGIQTNNFYLANPGAAAVISGNILSYNVRGIFHNLHYQNASAFTISNNTIAAGPGAVAGSGGLQIFSIQTNVGVTLSNNTITGGTYGIELWNLPTTNTVTVSGGSVTGAGIGIWVTNTDPSYGLGDPSTVVLSNVAVSGSTVAGIEINGAGANAVSASLSGMTITGGPIGLRVTGSNAALTGNTLANTIFIGQTDQYVVLSNGAHFGTIVNAATAMFDGTLGSVSGAALEDKITHKIDDAGVGLVQWVANTIFVTDTNAPTATNNDYTRINNAVQAAGNGYTISLVGTFNWNELNALASWHSGSDYNLGTTADNYEIKVPGGLNGVTFTALGGLGTATIQGPGDLATANLEAFLEFDGGSNASDDNQNWTISNLIIRDFDLSIGMFNSGAGSDAFNGTLITNNQIRVPADLNTVDAPADVNQNIGIHYSFGTNQTISNNTIEIVGSGVSNGSNFSSSVGMQSNTSGGAVYNGLLIDNNTINVTGTLAGAPSTVLGIWENGHAHQSNITVRFNDFFNLTGANSATNLMRAFRVTSHSGASSTVTYNANTASGANIGFQWIAGSNFAAEQPIVVTNNVLTGNATGFLIQSNGKATMSGNSITGNSGIGIDVLAGSTLTITSGSLQNLDIGIRTAGAGSISGVNFNAATDNLTDIHFLAGSTTTLGTGNLFGGSNYFINNESTLGHDLTGYTAANFEGLDPTTLPGAFGIEDLMRHTLDVGNTSAGLIRVVADNLYVTSLGSGVSDESIQNAINAADLGDTVNIQAGTYTGVGNVNVLVNKKLTIDGDTSGTTIVNGGGSNDGFIIAASGANAGDRLVIRDVQVANANAAFRITGTANFVTLDSVNANTSGNGFSADSTSSVNDLKILNSSFASNLYGISSTADTSVTNNETRFNNILLKDVTVSGNSAKGIYFEKANNLTLDNVDLTQNNADNGLDLNLKYGSYSSVQIINGSSFSNSGTGSAAHIKGRNDSYGASTNLNGLSISNSSFTSTAATASGLSVGNAVTGISFSGASFSGTGNGILFYMTSPSALSLGNTVFTSGTYVVNATPFAVDGTGAKYNGVDGGITLSTSNAYAITDKILDAVDVSGFGLVRLRAGNVYVTPNSFYAPLGTTSAKIQRGVDAADAGDTVNVQLGTYSENLTINKDIDLLGDSAGGTTLTSSVSGSKLITILGAGVFGTADNQVSISYLNLDGASTADYGVYVEGSANLGTLSLANADVKNTRQNGVYVNAKTTVGPDPTVSAMLGQLTLNALNFTNNGINGGGGSGDIQLFGYNNNATLTNLTLVGSRNEGAGTGGRGAIQFRGVGSGSGSGLAAMGNVSLNNVDISGSYRNTMISIQRYSTASSLSLSGVKLGGGTSALTGGFGAALRFDAVGSGTVASPATVNLGNTLFRGLTGPNAYNQVFDIEFAPDNGFAFLRADARSTQWNTAGNVASGLSLIDAFAVENRILHYVDKLNPTHFAFGGYRGYADLQTNKVFVTDQANVALAGEGSIQRAVQLSSSGYTVHVDAGTYSQDVLANVAGITLLGSGAASTIIEGAENNGNFTTLEINQPNITVAGFTITRTGNSLATWTDAGLNNQGVSIYSTGTVFRDNIVTGNRNGIYIDGGAGNVLIRNNIIEKNRTGIHVYQVNGLTIAENYIRENWTMGLLFRNDDVVNNSTGPITVFNNSIYGNYYAGLEQRWNNTSVVINAVGNWWGTSAPVHVTNNAGNSGEPGYANTPLSVPAYIAGGTGVPISGAPDILESQNPSTLVQFAPFLTSGVDTNVSNYGDTFSFQGDLASIGVLISGPTTVDEDATNPYTLLLSPNNPGTPTITGWSINWGDGSPVQVVTGNPLSVQHLYPDGTNSYVISATATTTSGPAAANSINLTVNNVAPSVAITGAPLTSDEGTSIILGSTVTDPALAFDPLVYSWNVTKDGNPYAAGTSTGITFTPNDNGVYVVTLTVNDGDGGITMDTKTITVGNLAPSISIDSATNSIDENAIATIIAAITDASSVDSFSVSIDWADANSVGTTVIGGLLSSGGIVSGTVGTTNYSWNPATRKITLTHLYTDDGASPGNGSASDVSSVSLSVSDDDGGLGGPISTNITVSNLAPTSLAITASGGNVYDEGNTLNFTASASDNVNDVLSYSWTVSGPGGFSAAGTGTAISFVAPDDGTYTFSLTVTDDDTGVATLNTYSVNVVDVAPRVLITSKTSPVGENSPSSVTFKLVDPGAGDLLATAQVSIDWGDGVSPTTLINSGPELAALQGGGTVTVTKTYNDNPLGFPTGSYTLAFSSIQVQLPSVLTYSPMALDGTSLPATLQVNNLNPSGLFVTSTPTVIAGNPVSVNWLFPTDPSPVDASSLHYSYGIDPDGAGPLLVTWIIGNGTYAGSGTSSSAVLAGSNFPSPGVYTVVSRVLDKDGGLQESSTLVTVTPASFRVINFTPNASGFDITFNRNFDQTLLNLYSVTGVDPADVVLSGPSGVVLGSLVFTGANTITFVATGGILPNGNYSVTLRSASDGFRDSPASVAPFHLLDGNNNNVGGDDYSASFNVANSGSTRVVSIPDFARGPGQIVQVPADLPRQAYLPIQVNAGANIGSLDVQLRIDPSMLTVTSGSFTLSTAALSAGWVLTVNQLLNGDWTLVANGVPASLSTASLTDVIIINGTVPMGAAYGSSEVIRIVSTKVSGITAIGDNAVHAVAYLGDADGTDTLGFTGRYTGNDAALIRSVAGGVDGGFNAYPRIDPGVIADIDGLPGILNALSGNDASIVALRAAFYDQPTAVPQIPPVPGEAPGIMAPTSGTFAVPSVAALPVNRSVTVIPMRLSSASTGATSAMFTVELPAGISLTESNGLVLSNEALAAGALLSTQTNAMGQIVVVVYSARPLPTGVSLVNLSIRRTGVVAATASVRIVGNIGATNRSETRSVALRKDTTTEFVAGTATGFTRTTSRIASSIFSEDPILS